MNMRSLKFEDFMLYDSFNKKVYTWETDSTSIIINQKMDLKLLSRCPHRILLEDSPSELFVPSLETSSQCREKLILSIESNQTEPCISFCNSFSITLPVKEKKNVKLVRRKLITKNDLKYYDWYIDPSEIIIGPKIGSGTFGTVYKAQWHGDVAVKMLNLSEPNEEQIEAFANELAVLRRTRHINILLFVGCLHFPRMAIVTQWCDGSTLYDQLHVESIEYPIRVLVHIALQISLGLEYLHAKKIIHRDLKSKNIFLQNGLHVKIGDFGLATLKNKILSINGVKQPTGSILWMAPEIIRMSSDDPYTPASDVYAFGIVLFELLSHELPYIYIHSKDEILYMVGRGYLKPDDTLISPNYPDSLIDCYYDSIKYDKEERIHVNDITEILQNLDHTLPKFERSMSLMDFLKE